MNNKLLIIKKILSNPKNYWALSIWLLYRLIALPLLLMLVLIEWVNNKLLDFIEGLQRFLTKTANFLVDNAPHLNLKITRKGFYDR